MLAKLLDHGGAAGQRREIAITKDEFLIGRGSDCDLRLGVSAISRHHCMLSFRKGEVTVADLGSANGTFVNGQRIRSQTTIKQGDEIGLGDFRFVVELQGASGIDWGPAADAASESPTMKVGKSKPSHSKKDESHPQGDAGG